MTTLFSLPIRKTLTATLLSFSLATFAISTTQAAEIEMSFKMYYNKNVLGLDYKVKL
jgi:triacylglycerol lipase